MIIVDVPGAPVPCARPRVTKRGTFLPARVRQYENKVRICADAQCKRDGWSIVEDATYEVSITIHRAQLRGDWDNFAKALTDPLNGIIWKDDRQVRKATVVMELDRVNPRARVVVLRRIGGE